MGKAFVLLALMVSLGTTSAQAREVTSFTVSDGQASYAFALAESGKKLFYHSYQDPGYGDMASQVFAYEPKSAPADHPVIRAEIAEQVRWLFLNDRIRLDTVSPVDLPGGIVCYQGVLIATGKPGGGVGVRFVVEGGAIRRVEAAMSNGCAMDKQMIEAYEAKKPGS